MKEYNKDSRLFEVLKEVPGSLDFLIRKGICGLSCADPDLGTIESAALRKGYNGDELRVIVLELNKLALNKAAGE